MAERIQKILANAGLGSRREIERMMEAGRVKINGKLAKLGDKIEENDKVTIDGRKVNTQMTGESKRRVIIYHKKEGEVCTRSDPDNRPTIFENLPKIKGERWIAIGRLDINTSGLLLLTTDGEFANKLMHPSFQVPREYAVRVRGEVTEAQIAALKEGVLLDDGMARFNDIVYSGGENQNQWYHVVLLEGRNREVRRLWESQGLTVSRLKRVRYGTIVLTQKVRQGKTVELNEKEIASLEDMLNAHEQGDLSNEAISESTTSKKTASKNTESNNKASKNKASKDTVSKNTESKTTVKRSAAKNLTDKSKPKSKAQSKDKQSITRKKTK